MPSQHLSVLMISTKLDPHVDAVLERLEGRGVPCFRLNTDHFHEEYRVTMTDEPTGTIRLALSAPGRAYLVAARAKRGAQRGLSALVARPRGGGRAGSG